MSSTSPIASIEPTSASASASTSASASASTSSSTSASASTERALSPEQRRGLRMAAQVACALSLLGAGASLARAEPTPAERAAVAGSPAERAADLLRLRSGAGNCVPTWGPAAPPPVDPALFAQFLAEAA